MGIVDFIYYSHGVAVESAMSK